MGDCAYILHDLPLPAYILAEALSANPPDGLIEAVASYETVGLYVDPVLFDIDALEPASFVPSKQTPTKVHKIPVCYELGPDLHEVCAQLDLSLEQVAERHSAQTYRCFAVGFCPGFAYLGYLPPELAGVPRRASPRTVVEAGSVAITGNQTAVYPLERPGGWALIGKTPLCLVNVEEHYFPITAGDEVRFHAIGAIEYEARLGGRL